MSYTHTLSVVLGFWVILSLSHPVVGAQSLQGERVEALIRNVERRDFTVFERIDVMVETVKGDTAWVSVPERAVQTLRSMGYDITVLPERRESARTEGYHSYSEMVAVLQNTATNYSNICRLYAIGKSYQNRDLYFIKITDNPDEQEDEPEFRYIATMHGKEPLGMEICLRLIQYITENYGIDSEITSLVDDIEIWIMPLMNPDGYVAQTRSNAQGFDLNRGFPDRIYDPVNTSAGRPAEVAVIMEWGKNHSSVLAGNIHSGACVVNYPYDSTADPENTYYEASPDDALFIAQASTYAALNPRIYNDPYFDDGITNGVEWYPVQGSLQDWSYVWMGCNEVTIEVFDGYIVDASWIPIVWQENQNAMIAYMKECLKGLRGIVTDKHTGAPLAATVLIDGNEHAVYTDPDVGDYHRMVLPGEYDVRIVAEGYADTVYTGIQIAEGRATRLDVEMIPSDTFNSVDLNRDGVLNMADVISALKIISGEDIDELENLVSDVNGNVQIGLEEILYLLRIISEK